MNDSHYLPRHAAPWPDEFELQQARNDLFNRLAAYSRRNGLGSRVDRRRALRESLRAQRRDHFSDDYPLDAA